MHNYMKNIHSIILLISLASCSHKVTEVTLPTSQSNLCECINSVSSSLDSKERLNKNMDCIFSESGNYKDSFNLVLTYAINNCEGFSKTISELNLSIQGFDSIDFVQPTPELCENNLNGKWRDILSDDSTYAVYYSNRVEHYDSNSMTGQWRILSKNGCKTTYVVTEQNQINPYPPNIGDTITATTIGVNDSLTKNKLQMRNIEVITIGIKINE